MPSFPTSALLPLIALVPALAAPACADLVRWINPAGGAFEEGSNWDAGHAPLAGDTAVFDLAATYVVTLSDDVTVDDCIVGNGAVTLELGESDLSTSTVTCTSGTARINNGVVKGRVNANGGTIHVLPSALFDRGGSAGNGGHIHIAGTVGKTGDGSGFFSIGSASTVMLAPTGQLRSRSITVNGALTIDEGFINAEVLMVFGTLSMDGGLIQGENGPLLLPGSQTHMLNGAVIAANSGIAADGVLLVEGAGTSARVGQVKGLMRLEDGGEARPFSSAISVAQAGRVEVGNGGILTGQFYRADQGVLRLEQGSVGPTNGFLSFGLYAETSLELVIDAAASPRFLARSFSQFGTTFDCELAGSLVIELLNPNALRCADEISLFTLDHPVIGGNFSTLTAPSLPGGRDIEAEVTPTRVLLRVVPGGDNPCWTADFNGDDAVGTDQDIEAFFACIGGTCCATCGSADFNNDGDTATDQDIESFFRVMSGAPC